MHIADECADRREEGNETFITKVNAQLPKDSQINIKDAMDAKKVFDEEQIGKKAASDYNTFASKIHKLPFGSDNLLQNRSISNLKHLVYANNWDKEFDVESTNNRQEILSFLYHKLDEAIAEKIKEKNNINEDDIPKVNKDYMKDNSYFILFLLLYLKAYRKEENQNKEYGIVL